MPNGEIKLAMEEVVEGRYRTIASLVEALGQDLDRLGVRWQLRCTLFIKAYDGNGNELAAVDRSTVLPR